MNSWFVWGSFALVALVLGLVGYHFSLRVLRVAAALSPWPRRSTSPGMA